MTVAHHGPDHWQWPSRLLVPDLLLQPIEKHRVQGLSVAPRHCIRHRYRGGG